MSTGRPATTDPADERMRDLADQRAEDFVNNLTGRAEQEHIRKVIAEAVRKAVPMHSGGWVTANNVLDALDRAGYTVAGRAEPVDVAWPDLLDAAYRERAHLVAHLASLYPDRSVMHPATDVDEPGWGVVYIDTDAGQMSWHIAPSDMDLFEHVPWNPEGAKSPWDGHTTEQKYERLRALTARQRTSQGHQEPVSIPRGPGAAQGGEGGSAAESEPRDTVGPGYDAVWTYIRTHPGDAYRNAAIWRAVEAFRDAVIPAIRAQVADGIEAATEARVRAQIAAQIEAIFVLARRDQSPAEAKADAYRTAAAIARGDQ